VEPRTLMARLERDEHLDGLVALGRAAAERLPRSARPALRGDWLGHPLHPLLTDLPIGFWTSAFVLDLAPTRRTDRIATLMVGLGLASALPTAAAGLADWASLSRARQRVGSVHAVANLVGTALYAGSLVHRLRGRRMRGVALALTGAAAMTVGGYLGGHLVFGTQEPGAAHEPDAAEPDGTRDASRGPSTAAAAATRTFAG